MADPVTIADIYALFQASLAEDDCRSAEADRRAAEADRRAAEADRRLQKLERIAANTSRDVAGLTTRWGQFVENLVAPAVIRLFQERGIEVQGTGLLTGDRGLKASSGKLFRDFRANWLKLLVHKGCRDLSPLKRPVPGAGTLPSHAVEATWGGDGN